MTVEMASVVSSAIRAVGYDEKAKELHVQFTSGDTHVFENVKSHVHEALINADSVGSHFHKHIRDKFDSRRK